MRALPPAAPARSPRRAHLAPISRAAVARATTFTWAPTWAPRSKLRAPRAILVNLPNWHLDMPLALLTAILGAIGGAAITIAIVAAASIR